MKTLRSYVCGGWHEPSEGFATLFDPSTEEPLARVSSHGIDFAAVLAHARETGGRALRELGLAERAGLLASIAKALHAQRDELLEISMRNGGTTRRDAKFDVDGAGNRMW